MAFMGVRMSWLMEERNELLARLASSAAVAARSRRARISWSAVTSVSEKRVFSRSASITGRAVMRSHCERPSAELCASNSQVRALSPAPECTMAATWV